MTNNCYYLKCFGWLASKRVVFIYYFFGFHLLIKISF